MKIEEFRRVIQERIACHEEWADGIERCWKKEVEILTEDISSTIEFLNNECTADEYSWISEVLSDVLEIMPSKELVQTYKALMSKFPEECQTYNISGCVENAEAILRWTDEPATDD